MSTTFTDKIQINHIDQYHYNKLEWCWRETFIGFKTPTHGVVQCPIQHEPRTWKYEFQATINSWANMGYRSSIKRFKMSVQNKTRRPAGMFIGYGSASIKSVVNRAVLVLLQWWYEMCGEIFPLTIWCTSLDLCVIYRQKSIRSLQMISDDRGSV